MAWGLIDQLSGGSHGFADRLSPHERYRQRERVDRLKASDDPVPLLRSWLRRRAERIQLYCAPGDLGDLAQDARVVKSGISDPRSGMSAASELEFYVPLRDRAAVVAEYLLGPSARPNVVVHVSHYVMPEPPPLIVLAADLADHNAAREESQARKVLQAALWS
jgi:hypothetical protein